MLDVFVKSVIFTLLSESYMSVTLHCEDGMENPSLRITIWHPDGRVFYSILTRIMDFFLFTDEFHNFILNKLLEVPDYTLT